MSSKRYTEEFRAEAVKQIIDRGYSVQEVSQRLGVSTHSLYKWLKASGRWGDKAQGDEMDAIQQPLVSAFTVPMSAPPKRCLS